MELYEAPVTTGGSVTLWPELTVEEEAVKLVMTGAAPVGAVTASYTVPICTTSKLAAVTAFRALRSESFQRASGVPSKNMFDPLSARIIPYCFIARRITWLVEE